MKKSTLQQMIREELEIVFEADPELIDAVQEEPVIQGGQRPETTWRVYTTAGPDTAYQHQQTGRWGAKNKKGKTRFFSSQGKAQRFANEAIMEKANLKQMFRKFFKVAPGISVKDLFKFYARVNNRVAEKVSRLIQDGNYAEARRIINKVLSQ